MALNRGNSESESEKRGKGLPESDPESDNSYNWEEMENNPTPDIIDVAYYTA